jgi:hypothetical protein
MATEPDIVSNLHGFAGEAFDDLDAVMFLSAANEIEALRSRVAAQDADLTRLRGLVERLADDADPLRSTVAFLRSVIASGEPVSPSVEQAVDNAFTRLDRMAEARAEVPR